MDFGSVIADAGELYLHFCLEVLQDDHAGVPFTNSHHFKAESCCQIHRTNDHLFAEALTAAMKCGLQSRTVRTKAKILADLDLDGWNTADVLKIWRLGPETTVRICWWM